MFSMHQNPDLSNKILACLLMATVKVQSMGRKDTFRFVSDVNAHYEDFLRSSMMNLHCRAAHDFALSLGCVHTHWWRGAGLGTDRFS